MVDHRGSEEPESLQTDIDIEVGMNKELIRKTEAFLKEKFEQSEYLAEHPEVKRYRLEHSYRVANIGVQIAREEGFDETEMVIACLLHDISYCETFGEGHQWADHGRSSARMVRPFLKELGLKEDRVEQICYGIAIHVDDKADFPGEHTPFARTVLAADNIDRFDVYRIHETLSYEGFLNKSLQEQIAMAEKRIADLKLWIRADLGTKSAQAMWTERLSWQIRFYEKLLGQLKSSSAVLDQEE